MIGTKFNWLKQNNIIQYVELDEPINNLCTFNKDTKVIQIPDKIDKDPLEFRCDDLNFAEIILFRFLKARNKSLKEYYYAK